MLIRGYGERFPDPLEVERVMYNGAAFMERPGFWAAHYLNQSIEDEKLVAQVWGMDRDAVRQMQTLLSRPTAWPIFKVNARQGAELAVVYRNFEGDFGVDYLVTPGPAEECIRIATLEGEYEGPGISWGEIIAVARSSPGPVQRARTLLLLAPMLGDVEAEQSGAIDLLVEALRSSGGTGAAESLARLIASENLQWEPAHWYTAPDGATVCDAEASPRNPDSVHALSQADMRTVSDTLAS